MTAGKRTAREQENPRGTLGKTKLSKGLSMTGASKILIACAAAIGLSALICTPARAQPSSLAPATQSGDTIDHSGTGSLTAEPLPELAVTPASTALGGQSTPPPSITTRALLPGHWALYGSNYVWVPPEIRLHKVQTATLLQGSYVWRNGAYVWVPTHYANP
jgi:hypothetical protein